MSQDKLKSISDVFTGICVLFLVLHFAGIFSVDILFDDDGKSVLKKHQSFTRSDLTERDFVFFIKSNPTDLQKDKKIELQKNKIIQWTGKVENVEKNRDHYIVEMKNDLVPDNDALRLLADGLRFFMGVDDYTHVDSACGRVFIFPVTAKDSQNILNLKKGDAFRFEGMLSDINSRGCVTIKYGLLSKDQSRLSDSGYFSELISEALTVVSAVESNFQNSQSAKNFKLTKADSSCLPDKVVRYKTNLGDMTVESLSDTPWDKKMQVKVGGKQIRELVKVSKCPDLWSSTNGFEYWVFYAGEGGNACDGPYKILSLGEGRTSVSNVDTCYGFDVLMDKNSITFNRHNIQFVEPNLGPLR